MQTRLLRADEIETIRDIERAAGVIFLDVGMPEIASHEPMSAAELGNYVAAGRAWVAVDDDNEPIAYVIVDVVDGAAHIEQLSTHPQFARQGIGRQLIDHVAVWAAASGYPAITLTTFRDVPWNAPYYERCGFRALTDAELGPELRDRYLHEAEYGLDPALRVCMRRLNGAASRPR